MSLGELDVGLERGLDDVRVGVRPGHADEHADVAALDEPEAAGAAGDLRELPRQQVPPLDPVELRRLGEEEGLARQVDAVAEHVGRDTDLGGAREEAVDLLPARRERHRAVEHGDAVGPEPVDLAREREHGLAAERDDDRARRERAQLSRADELERQLPLVDAQLGVGERAAHERQRVERAEQADVAVLPGEEKLRPRRAPLLVVRPLHLVEDEHLTRFPAPSRRCSTASARAR